MACKTLDIDNLSVAASQLFSLKQSNFFSSIPWYRNWITTVLNKELEQAVFLAYEQENKVQLLLPLKRSIVKSGMRSLDSLGNYYTPFFQLPFVTGQCDFLTFFKQLKTLKPQWDTLTLQPMAKAQVQFLLPILKEARLLSVPYFCFVNWYLEVNQQSFDQYFASLSSRVKNTVNRKTKQFNRLAGARIEVLTQKEDLDKAIHAFETVYALSWKQQEPHTEFMPGLIKTAMEQGAMRVGVAYLNECAIAAQFWIVADKTAYIYKLAYDEKYKRLSIGSILTATLMRHAIDIDKVACVDYLSGDDAYKKEWMSAKRERWGMMIFNSHSWRAYPLMLIQLSKYYAKKFLIRNQCYNL